MTSLRLAVAVFLVYAWGACPTIYVGDSGELVAAVYVLGIPHPSGYPLYVLLGKLFTLLVPLGSIAYRMSLFSAACSATAVGVVHSTCRRAGLGPVASLTGALLFAFAPSHWGEANVQRAYSLNALFVAAATAVAFEWDRTRRPRLLVAAFVLCGLGATNHTFMAVYAIVLALFAVISEPSLLKRPRTLLEAAAACAVGLLPYAFLPLRSRMEPPLDWGNPDSLDRFVAVVTRRDFWDRKWLQGPADLVPIAADYLSGLGAELLWVGLALAAVGSVEGRRKRAPVPLLLGVMAANLATMAAHGSRTDIFVWHRYYIPSYLVAALLVALGAQALVERLPSAARAAPLLLPLVALLVGFRSADRSRYRIAESYSRTLLATLPPGAHLAASDDNILFVLIYLRLVEGLRPDVDLILQGVGDAELPPLRFDPDDDLLYFTHHPNWSMAGLEIAPAGLALEPVRAGRPWPEPPPLPDVLEGEDDPRVPKDYLTQNLIGEFHYMKGVSLERRDWARASEEFERAKRASPENDVLFFNLGLIYRRNGRLEDALEAFRRSDTINPRAIASRSRAVAADKVRELEAELGRSRTP